MSVRDIVTRLNLGILISTDIAGNGVSLGTPFDGHDDEMGIVFFLTIRGVYTDGSYVMSLQDSADDGAGAPLGDWADIPANKILHGGSDIPGNGGVTGSAVSSAADSAELIGIKLGAFSERRWIRPIVTATGVTTGATGVTVDGVSDTEYPPQ
jgi:hypothetical protein